MSKGLIITYLLTYGGVAATLFNPFNGLLVYICFAIIKPESLWHWSVPAGNYSRIVAIALLAGWVMHGLGTWRFGKATAVVVMMMGFWAWAVLGALRAPLPAVAWQFVEDMSKIFLPFLVGMTLIDSVRKLKQLAWVILLSQGYVALELNLSYLDGFNRIREAGFGGLDNNSMSIALVCCIGLAFFLGMATEKLWAKALALFTAIVMVHAVLFSNSRGGMLGLIFTAVAIFLMIPKRPKHYLIFALAILITMRLAGPGVQARFATTFAGSGERDGAAQSRLDLWKKCVELMGESPVLGVGPDHFLPLSVSFWTSGNPVEAHNLWLQIGAEMGIPGLAFLALFYLVCMARLWPLTRDRYPVDPWLPDAARMVIAALIGFAVSASFVSLEGLEMPYYTVLVGAGILKVHSELEAAGQAAVYAPASARYARVMEGVE